MRIFRAVILFSLFCTVVHYLINKKSFIFSPREVKTIAEKYVGKNFSKKIRLTQRSAFNSLHFLMSYVRFSKCRSTSNSGSKQTCRRHSTKIFISRDISNRRQLVHFVRRRIEDQNFSDSRFHYGIHGHHRFAYEHRRTRR